MKKNKVSLKPVEYRVLVLPDQVSDELGEGILIKTKKTKENDIRSQTRGTIILLSDVAFSDKWYGTKPKVGDKIEYAMYAGQQFIENDVKYIIMNDQDIIGLIKEQK